MSETTTQANHELLLGLGKDMKIITHAMETLSQQLQTLTATVGPALGMCEPCVSAWIDRGEDPEIGIPSAQTVIVVPGVGVVPVCLWHYRDDYRSQKHSQLLVAQPGMPQSSLIVPGR
jgi:hypothetical protein